MDYPDDFYIACLDSIKQPVAPNDQHANVFPWNIFKYAAQIRIFSQKICHSYHAFGKALGRLHGLTGQVADDLLKIGQAIRRPSY